MDSKSYGLQTITFLIFVSVNICSSSFRNLSSTIIVSACESTRIPLSSLDVNSGLRLITFAPVLSEPKKEIGKDNKFGSIIAMLLSLLIFNSFLKYEENLFEYLLVSL